MVKFTFNLLLRCFLNINDMRTKVAMIACMFVVSMILSSCNHSKQSSNSKMEDNKMKNEVVTSNEPLFGLGESISANFTGEAWLQPLSSVDEYDCSLYNVTFAPGTRNNWHSHAVGQILLCTEGIGYYQEEGKAARRLVPGSVVNIPANTLHWHGAAPDSRFTHIGITPKVGENSAEWGDPVTDEEYNVAVQL